MNRNIVLVAETGSDITPELAREHNIYLVPMHVSMGDVTLNDGSFSVEDVCNYYNRTGKVPQTSACSPADFENVFDDIHKQHILHLAYSAVTTCSYQSALVASEGRSYITSVDTKHVSVGQAAVVIEVARLLNDNPDIQITEAVNAAVRIANDTKMCFIADNLDYLRAGGRVSNAAAMTGNLLNLHLCIEIIDGHLMARKKYRGSINHIIPKVIRDFSEKHSLDKEQLYLIWSVGLSEGSRKNAEAIAKEKGFRKVTWMKTGCVITCHGGPGCFGIVGFSRNNMAELQ